MKLSLSAPTDVPTGAATGPRAVEPPPLVSDIAAHFPPLEILECLGRGGMGVVYKARQPKLNRLVALKILAREKENEAHFAERFLREAQALARLNHQNIVTVYDFGEADGLFYLLMEFVDGMNLRELLRTRKMAPEEAIAIVPPICEALQYAHEQGIVHRDIKPENILLDKQGRLKIADFGIAKILGTPGGEEALTGGRSLGTPHYMAPEQVEKPQSVDHRADIFSLGVVFYEMLTGELPLGKFSAPSRMVHVDVRLDEVVLRALEKEPDRRYQHASQVKTQVENIVRTPPVIGGEPSASPLPRNNPVVAPSPHPAPAGAPRYSRFAIWGAVWAGFFLVTAPLLAVWGTEPHRSSFFALGPREIVFLVGPVLFFPALIGFTAPFGATILGWLAISEIRRSPCRIDGLGMADFDALLFPLALMASAIFMTLLIIFKALARGHGGDDFFMMWMLMSLVTSGAAGYFIVRAVWRKAVEPLPGGVSAPSARTAAPASTRFSPLTIAGIACGILTTLLIFLMPAFSGGLSQFVSGLAVLGLFGTLVLGICGFYQVERSQGRYRGRLAALVPLLLCPLLMMLFGFCFRSQVRYNREVYLNADQPEPQPSIPPPPDPAALMPAAPVIPPAPAWPQADSAPVPQVMANLEGLISNLATAESQIASQQTKT